MNYVLVLITYTCNYSTYIFEWSMSMCIGPFVYVYVFKYTYTACKNYQILKKHYNYTKK